MLGKRGSLLSHNIFAYCENNPVVNADPSGESLLGVIAVILGAGLLLSGCAPKPPSKSSSKPNQSPSGNNTVYANPYDVSITQFNCMGWAFGEGAKLLPGTLSNRSREYSLRSPIEKFLELTIADLNSKGYNAREVDQTHVPQLDTTMIALRQGPRDFHLMKRMEDGSWTHKPGGTSILTLNGNPWDYPDKWEVEYTSDGTNWGIADIYYDSEIKYVVYGK